MKGLASKILSRTARQLPRDWERRYAVRPLLLETLVDARRCRGTCYRAANWIHVGQTSGRGRMDRENKAQGQAVKDIYLYPWCAMPANAYAAISCGKQIPFVLRDDAKQTPFRPPIALTDTS